MITHYPFPRLWHCVTSILAILYNMYITKKNEGRDYDVRSGRDDAFQFDLSAYMFAGTSSKTSVPCFYTTESLYNVLQSLAMQLS